MDLPDEYSTTYRRAKGVGLCRVRAESRGGRRKQPTRGRSLGEVHISGLTASGDTAVVTLTPPDSQASHAEEERRCPTNGPHFQEHIDNGRLPPADLSAIKE
jgi:hypothetical protein